MQNIDVKNLKPDDLADVIKIINPPVSHICSCGVPISNKTLSFVSCADPDEKCASILDGTCLRKSVLSSLSAVCSVCRAPLSILQI